jgi:hypothetical protein
MSLLPRSLIRASLSIAAAAAVCLTPALAGSSAGPSPAELIEALKSKGQRGLQPSAVAANPAEDAAAVKLIETLREKATRGLSASTQVWTGVQF